MFIQIYSFALSSLSIFFLAAFSLIVLTCYITNCYITLSPNCSSASAPPPLEGRCCWFSRLAAEPCSTTGFLFPSQRPSGTSCWPRIRWCGTGGFQEQGQCFLIGLSCSIPTIVFYYFPFPFFLSIGWYCGAAVFGLVGCTSLSLSLALLTSFNNSNNNDSIKMIKDQ